MGRSSTINVRDSIRWCPGKSVQIEKTWVWSIQNRIRIVEIQQKISMPNYQKNKDHGEEELDQKLRLRNFDAKPEQWSSIERERVVLKEEKVPVTSGKKKSSVRKETNAVSGMRVTIVPRNQTSLPPHLPSHPGHGVEVCRRKEVSKAKVTMVPFSDNRADIIWRVLARDRLVNIGILPSVNFTKQKRVAKPGISVCSASQGWWTTKQKAEERLLFP